MNLQSRYDLEIAEDELSKKISQDVRPRDLASSSRS